MKQRLFAALRGGAILLFGSVALSQDFGAGEGEDARAAYEKYLRGQLPLEEPYLSPQDTSLEYLGRWGWGECGGVAAMGNYVMTGSGPTLMWLDVTDRRNPVVLWDTVNNLGTIEYSGARGFAIQDSMGYALMASKLVVVDLRNPHAARIIGAVELDRYMDRLVVEGSFVFVSRALGGLFIIDVSNPSSPYLRRVLALPSMMGTLAITNHNLYIGDSYYLTTFYINVSNPDSVPPATVIDLPPPVTALCARDTLLLVGNYSNRLYLYSIAIPDTPVFLSNLVMPDTLSGTTSIILKGDTAYVGRSQGKIVVVDISNRTHPVILGVYTTPSVDLVVGQLAAEDTVLYCSYQNGFATFSMANPASPLLLSFFPTGHGSGKVAVRNGLAYVASGLAGLWVVDVSDVSRPRRRGNIQTVASAYGMVVESDVAYLTVRSYEGGWNGIYAINVSNPDTLRILDSLAMERPYALSKSGSLLFVTHGDIETNPIDTTVTIVDVADPTNLQPVGYVIGGYDALEITSRDSIAFIAARHAGLKIFDCRDPANPQLLSTVFTRAAGVAVSGQRAYVHRIDSVFVLDIADLTTPVILGAIRSYQPRPGLGECELILAGNLLFWAHTNNYGAYHVSNPTQPTLAFADSRLFGVRDVGIVGDTLFVPQGSAGLWIFRYNPRIAFVANNEELIANSLRLSQNYPNPFNHSTTIRFEVATSGSISLKIYNVLGQEVVTLVSDELKAGSYARTFDASGLPSGIYFYRLTTSNHTITRKMVLL